MNAPMFPALPAVREATPALIGLWGPSGSGKTLSALRMARGLVGPSGKIVVVDTENGRAKFYAEEAGGWLHIDMQPPFTPERYTAAMESAEAAGADAIIFDSASHVWAGEGGVIDMAESVDMSGLGKWRGPKLRYTKMFNALLRSPVHAIFCLRSKELNQQKGTGKQATIISVGLVPICEKNFIYEMTLAFLLGPDHKPMVRPTETFHAAPNVPSFKVPDALLSHIPPNEYLSEATGHAIAEWIGAGAAVNEHMEALKRNARAKASLGSEAMRQHWLSLSPADKQLLRPIVPDLQVTAQQADAAGPASDEGSEEDDPFAPTPEPATPPAADALDDVPTETETPADEPETPVTQEIFEDGGFSYGQKTEAEWLSIFASLLEPFRDAGVNPKPLWDRNRVAAAYWIEHGSAAARRMLEPVKLEAIKG